MKKKKRSSFMLFTGILVGAAAVYFLKSEQGKEIISKVKKKGLEIKGNIESKSSEFIEAGKEVISYVVETSEIAAEEAAEQVSSIGDNIKDTVEDSLDDFQKGIEKAKIEINKA